MATKQKSFLTSLGERMGIVQPDPKELVKKWQSDLRSEIRKIEREIRKINMEQEKVKREVRQYANRGDIDAAKILAKEVVRTNQTVKRLYNSKAHILDVQTGLQEQLAMLKVAGVLQKSTVVMESMGRLIKAPEVMGTVRDLAKEMTKAGIMQEIMDDTFEGLDEPGLEEAAEEEVNKVLLQVAGDVISKVGLPSQQKLQAEKEAEEKEAAAQVEALKNLS